MQAMFCYRVSKEAGLGVDLETGKNAETYISFALRDKEDNVIEVDVEKYPEMHKQGIQIISEQIGLNPDHLTMISIEEYEEEAEE